MIRGLCLCPVTPGETRQCRPAGARLLHPDESGFAMTKRGGLATTRKGGGAFNPGSGRRDLTFWRESCIIFLQYRSTERVAYDMATIHILGWLRVGRRRLQDRGGATAPSLHSCANIHGPPPLTFRAAERGHAHYGGGTWHANQTEKRPAETGLFYRFGDGRSTTTARIIAACSMGNGRRFTRG